MASLRLLLALFVLAQAVGPSQAAALQVRRTDNPCGKAVCCCPQMCKMLKQKKFACQMRDRQRCGMKSAAQEAWLTSFSLEELLIPMVSHSSAGFKAVGSRMSHHVFNPFESAGRAPLDRPPAFLS